MTSLLPPRPPAWPFLRLVRLPNLFTAAADPLAGWLAVGGGIGELGRWPLLVAAGVALYAAGMILNDWFDLEIDREERPQRPLPSGQVTTRTAALSGFGLLIAAPTLAAVLGWPSLIVALALAGCILGYDGTLKKTQFGPLAMGACRSLNLLLGMTASPSLGGPAGWLAALAFGGFVAGVTWISRNEAVTGAHSTRPARIGVVVQGFAIALLGLAALVLGRGQASPWLHVGLGIGVLGATAAVVDRAGMAAIVAPSPATYQRAVKTGVFSLIWLDFGLAVATAGPLPAVAVALLWLPAYLTGKWLYST